MEFIHIIDADQQQMYIASKLWVKHHELIHQVNLTVRLKDVQNDIINQNIVLVSFENQIIGYLRYKKNKDENSNYLLVEPFFEGGITRQLAQEALSHIIRRFQDNLENCFLRLHEYYGSVKDEYKDVFAFNHAFREGFNLTEKSKTNILLAKTQDIPLLPDPTNYLVKNKMRFIFHNNKTLLKDFDHDDLLKIYQNIEDDVPQISQEIKPSTVDIIWLKKRLRGKTSFIGVLVNLKLNKPIAISEFRVYNGFETIIFQGNTGVLEEFRGKRLSQLLKQLSIGLIQKSHPEIKYWHTNNESTNFPMLRVNLDLGFKLISQRLLYFVNREY
jgi:hypothetical protein